ncbi:hypothetical protein CRI94_00565 [Longibacter salinarum]|uniref:Uncharacterized protein n=1 Tax=Longibacter salinarum TaxID=1850348 RepID=A0A2A8D1X4_9BACT|nr:hypothetical protein [Longibacter salinarum]PEN14823.1 hypothetical protein CRI94_00565 [Longibacter salinarum]
MSKHDEWRRARKQIDTDYKTWLYEAARYGSIPCLLIALILVLDATLPSHERERVTVWRVEKRVDRSWERGDWMYIVTNQERPSHTYLVMHVYRESEGRSSRSTLEVSDYFAEKVGASDTLSIRATPLLGARKNVVRLSNGRVDVKDSNYQSLLYLLKVIWMLTPFMALVNVFEVRYGPLLALMLSAEIFSLVYWYYLITHLLL